MRREGWIQDEADGTVAATPEGIQAAGAVESLPTDPDALLEFWKKRFRAGVGRMLDVLRAEGPVTRAGLSEAADVRGGSFGTYLGELNRNGLVEIEGKQVRLHSSLFK